MITALRTAFSQIATLGGPVVLLLIGVSVIALTVVFYKLWQFSVAHVGRHDALGQAIDAWDQGEREAAHRYVTQSKSYLRELIGLAMSGQTDHARLEAEAETRFARLESGFRILDMIAQLSPLMGLFGTVLGMISAFQSLQDAGAQVDPAVLAGGIWVALLTTAVGLAVAMPTSVFLSWFEARMDRDRIFAERALRTILSPSDRAHA
ncbi:MotA/TolQ/ExbB proton channel family protein [Celeribacter litoreus]|uniref:MotA/TolQ/ExbB proton channel family protein n=1 Tax=Celeribacter litoreus TaxID=2876714 RepID=UPI001CCCBC14|nr:MotA/TolQ/ExbB proton channel family protein [Celeribacter litoreus]MCA0043959.1 MotA/TolQ/ExbB proton channel family protein [Celeribacter litoreus]